MAPRLEDLLADVVALTDPIERFRALSELNDRPNELAALIRTARSEVVRELRARDPRPSWAEIGTLLGISGERARTLHDETTKESTP
jgi:hypothetical protein